LTTGTKEDLRIFLKNAARKAEVFKINAQTGGKFRLRRYNYPQHCSSDRLSFQVQLAQFLIKESDQ